MLAALSLAMALCADSPRIPPDVSDDAAVIELNHVYCPDTGRETFTQVIAWTWYEHPVESHHVAFWVSHRTGDSWRLRKLAGGGWSYAFEYGGVRRTIRARRTVETWTSFDPEIDDRARLPQDQRRGITPLSTTFTPPSMLERSP